MRYLTPQIHMRNSFPRVMMKHIFNKYFALRWYGILQRKVRHIAHTDWLMNHMLTDTDGEYQDVTINTKKHKQTCKIFRKTVMFSQSGEWW